MDINYRILFTVQLLHEYFMDDKSMEAEILPAKDSRLLFDNIDILWRNVDNRFIALVRENDLHEPFVNKPPEKRYRQFFNQSIFRLYLKLKKDGFYNYTNVQTGTKQIAYFSNLANNKVIVPPSGLPFFYLSQKIDDQLIGHEYLPGDFVMEPATDKTFEALKKHTSAAAAELADPALWQPRQLLQFPTSSDLITYAGASFVFTLSSTVSQATIKIFSFNFDPDTPDFSALIRTEVQQFDVPATRVKIDLHDLSPGRYKIEVEGETRMIYFDPNLTESRIYGVIEIFNHLPATNDYSFLGNGEEIITKDYTIQFPARNVLWKYIRKDNKAQSVTDAGSTNYVFNLNGDEFVSAVPIPLSETPLDTLRLNLSAPDFDLFPLPNPTGKRLTKHQQDDYDYSSAEIFLNY